MFILDTNICICIINNKPKAVRKRFKQLNLNDIAISSITLFELNAGAHKSERGKENLLRLEQFASLIQVLPFDTKAAVQAGQLRQNLYKRRLPIGDMDLLITAHALALEATLVSNNLREFERVEKLITVNWLE